MGLLSLAFRIQRKGGGARPTCDARSREWSAGGGRSRQPRAAVSLPVEASARLRSVVSAGPSFVPEGLQPSLSPELNVFSPSSRGQGRSPLPSASEDDSPTEDGPLSSSTPLPAGAGGSPTFRQCSVAAGSSACGSAVAGEGTPPGPSAQGSSRHCRTALDLPSSAAAGGSPQDRLGEITTLLSSEGLRGLDGGGGGGLM